MNLSRIYEAAHRHGMTVNATVGNVTRPVDFRSPDGDIFGGIATNREFFMRYPSESFNLSAGAGVVIGGVNYSVRGNPQMLTDGREMSAKLSRD